METEQLQEYAEWRAIQKERERERRRMRDRQRRQSMSLEEREKHLARRRRNYQLRRQRAANAQSSLQQQVNLMSTETAAVPSIRNDSLALVCVSEPSAEPDCAMQFAPSEANQVQNASAVKYGETALAGSYKYPRLLRLTQIKHLARLLNSSADKPFAGNQEMGADAINGEMAAPKGIPRKGIRFVHLKHFVRMINSKMGTTSEPNDSDKMQGGENDIMQREIETTSDRALWNRRSIDAIDEDEQICADSICNL